MTSDKQNPLRVAPVFDLTDSDTVADMSSPDLETIIATENLDVYYGDFRAVRDISMNYADNEITALIGPSGCGKSTVLRSLNRMNDLIPSARVEGRVVYHGRNIYESNIDPVEIRRRIGIVFQKPNPFPKSIFDNVAWGAKINGFKGSKSDLGDLVERALTQAALWDEVKDKLNESGYLTLRWSAAAPLYRSSGGSEPLMCC